MLASRLEGDYTARLADFGYASFKVGNIPEALAYLQRSTARPGALRWIAPEQVDPDNHWQDRYIFFWLCRSPGKFNGLRCQAHADILAGIVWQTTMVGNSGRRSGRLILGEGPQTRPAKVSNVE